MISVRPALDISEGSTESSDVFGLEVWQRHRKARAVSRKTHHTAVQACDVQGWGKWGCP